MVNRLRRLLASRFYLLDSREGFSLIELLLFVAIFSGAMIGFLGILVGVTRVQVRQIAAAEVNGQSQFVLQNIQRLVEKSSVIEMPTDTSTTTLKLRMASSTADPTYIIVQDGVVYLRETDAGSLTALTSNRVTVSSMAFKKRANPPGHDSVAVDFTVEYVTANPQQRFTQILDTAIARVSAATFDSNVVPSTGNIYKLGASAGDWQSVNNTIYFSGSNVGVGVVSPGQTLEVNGGIRVNTATAQPTCDSSQRGTVWIVQNAVATDTVQACIRQNGGTYAWTNLLGPSSW
ncbi:MAG: hypothetical protein AAB495_00095 [Patescibacteria group bacterium]